MISVGLEVASVFLYSIRRRWDRGRGGRRGSRSYYGRRGLRRRSPYGGSTDFSSVRDLSEDTVHRSFPVY